MGYFAFCRFETQKTQNFKEDTEEVCRAGSHPTKDSLAIMAIFGINIHMA